jgi:hypothetical protein
MLCRRSIALAAAVVSLAVAAPAQATVTIGSSLASVPSVNDPGCNSSPCTAVNLSLNPANQASNGLTSPVNGTVVSWRAASNLGVNLSLRILRPAGGASYAGAGTSTVANPGPGTSPPIPTSLPIKIGDFIGLNASPQFIYAATAGSTAGAWFMAPNGPLADGSTRAADATLGTREVLVQAVVEPSNTLKLGKPKVGKNGSTKLSVSVPNPGQITFTCKCVKLVGPQTITAAGAVTFELRARGKDVKKLREDGKVTIKPKFAFTPTNGVTGPTQTKKVKLVKVRPKV